MTADLSCAVCGSMDRLKSGKCRECNRKRAAAWRKANPERNRANIKAWEEKNRERLLKAKKAYRQAHLDQERRSNAAWACAHPERVKDRSREWRVANPERAKENIRRWNEKNADRLRMKRQEWASLNPEKVLASAKAYRNRNPHIVRANKANRRAREKRAGGKVSGHTISRLWHLQRGKCSCCKKPLGDDFHLDHIISLYAGGDNSFHNLQLMRKECNLSKNAKDPIKFMQQRGFLL